MYMGVGAKGMCHFYPDVKLTLTFMLTLFCVKYFGLYLAGAMELKKLWDIAKVMNPSQNAYTFRATDTDMYSSWVPLARHFLVQRRRTSVQPVTWPGPRQQGVGSLFVRAPRAVSLIARCKYKGHWESLCLSSTCSVSHCRM
jgi:hypothetical protein